MMLVNTLRRLKWMIRFGKGGHSARASLDQREALRESIRDAANRETGSVRGQAMGDAAYRGKGRRIGNRR